MLRRPEDDTLALVRKLHSFTNDNFSSSSSSISLSPSSSPPPLQDTSAASSLRWSQSSTSTSSVSPSFDDSAPIEFGQLALSAIEANATTAASPPPSNDAFARELSTLGLEDAAVTGLLDVYRRVVRSAEDTTAEAYEEATTISRQALARLQAAVTPDEFDEHFAQSVPQLLPAAYERAHREHLSALNDVALAAVRARCLQKPHGVKVPRPGLAPKSAALLKQVYAQNMYPNSAELRSLASQIGISYKQCRVWFQNRRNRKDRSASGPGPDRSVSTSPGHDSFLSVEPRPAGGAAVASSSGAVFEQQQKQKLRSVSSTSFKRAPRPIRIVQPSDSEDSVLVDSSWGLNSSPTTHNGERKLGLKSAELSPLPFSLRHGDINLGFPSSQPQHLSSASSRPTSAYSSTPSASSVESSVPAQFAYYAPPIAGPSARPPRHVPLSFHPSTSRLDIVASTSSSAPFDLLSTIPTHIDPEALWSVATEDPSPPYATFTAAPLVPTHLSFEPPLPASEIASASYCHHPAYETVGSYVLQSHDTPHQPSFVVPSANENYWAELLDLPPQEASAWQGAGELSVGFDDMFNGFFGFGLPAPASDFVDIDGAGFEEGFVMAC